MCLIRRKSMTKRMWQNKELDLSLIHKLGTGFVWLIFLPRCLKHGWTDVHCWLSALAFGTHTHAHTHRGMPVRLHTHTHRSESWLQSGCLRQLFILQLPWDQLCQVAAFSLSFLPNHHSPVLFQMFFHDLSLFQFLSLRTTLSFPSLPLPKSLFSLHSDDETHFLQTSLALPSLSTPALLYVFLKPVCHLWHSDSLRARVGARVERKFFKLTGTAGIGGAPLSIFRAVLPPSVVDVIALLLAQVSTHSLFLSLLFHSVYFTLTVPLKFHHQCWHSSCSTEDLVLKREKSEKVSAWAFYVKM